MKKLITILTIVILAIGQVYAEPIVTESTSNSTINTNGKTETTVKSPPPSAISPSINVNNSDLCTVGVAGAVQTQILGISAGSTVRDLNCERLKNAKTLYDMGMKVAAVSVMCQDERVFNAMMMAGTPCPYEGKIGGEAAELWAQNLDKWPKEQNERKKVSDTQKGFFTGGLMSILLMLAL